MHLFRSFLIAVLLTIIAYTSVVIFNHGINLIPVFFGDMLEMGWPGQFNLDFMTFLMLSAVWVAWRNQFTPKGLGLAVLAFFGGMLFLSIYLLILTTRHGSDIQTIMLGERKSAP